MASLEQQGILTLKASTELLLGLRANRRMGKGI